jgi:hypothetical protein
MKDEKARGDVPLLDVVVSASAAALIPPPDGSVSL